MKRAAGPVCPHQTFSVRTLVSLALSVCALLPVTAARAQNPGVPAGTPMYSVPQTAPVAGSPGAQQGRGAGTGANGNNPQQNGQQPSDQQQTQQQTEQQQADRQRDQANAQRATNTVRDLPTQFQQLVAQSTGTLLPIFGANLFGGVPSTFAPVEDIPVSPDYVLGPGDQLRIHLYGQVNQQGTYTISRTGDIAFPEVGTIHVAGIKYSDLERFLKSQFDRVYRNYELNVNLGQLRAIQVFVFGEARRPGAYTVSSLSTLLNALFASGGPSPAGSLRDIQLKRGDSTVVHLDLYDLLLNGDKSRDVPLVSGDVIFIPVVGPQVAVAGSVNNAAIYEIRPGTTVDQVLALAGGRTSVALGAQVRLERIFEHTMRSIVDVNTAQGQNPVLADGDIVTVATILDRYKDAVTLRGNVAFPGRYVWHAGMRLTDVVSSREQLITRDFYANRNALGNVSGELNRPAGPLGSLDVRGERSSATDSATRSGNTTSPQGSGNSAATAATGSNNIFPAQTDVVISAPDVDLSYAVIERLNPLTLTTVLIPFNPGKLYLEQDQSQNLELQPGDVITFFSTADLRVPTSQQTRFVRLEGEFVSSGVYSVEPGETFRHLLARVGGFTPDAYLYGSEFTRQSTRRVQQQRLNEYADSLEAQLSVVSANNNARALTDRDAAASQAAALDAREAIARLRRVVPLGRIVLQLKPDSRGVDSIPDLPLEDGDRFVVPRVPSTVAVQGQVYSANAFVFERGRRERDYLRQAGGPDRNADRKRTFILRADGSVYSRQYGNVDRATMFPGDTVVVPPQIAHRAILRDLVDLSSVVGQFGFTAAAISLFVR